MGKQKNGNHQKMIFDVLLLLSIVSFIIVSPVLAQNSAKNLVDQYEVESKIMFVDSNKSQIIVAERIISIDLADLRNSKGVPVEPSEIKKGQRVLVKGLLQPSGEVVATLVEIRNN